MQFEEYIATCCIIIYLSVDPFLMQIFIHIFSFCIHTDLWQMNRTWVFQGRGVPLQPQTMLLDEIHQRLYVGAKNALFSLGLDRVNAHYRQVTLASFHLLVRIGNT